MHKANAETLNGGVLKRKTSIAQPCYEFFLAADGPCKWGVNEADDAGQKSLAVPIWVGFTGENGSVFESREKTKIRVV